MLPRVDMVATRNHRRKIAQISAWILLGMVIGCKPPGPRALVQGDELLRQGKAAEAIEPLKRATSLLPEEPRGWNLLGLAYHRAGEPRLALLAYRQALAKDRSNVVAVTHYNLGVLLLEQGNTAAAADELRSYTLITNNVPGLVKLGTAQTRLRQFDQAERSFAAALRLDPKHYEALNGLGVVRGERNQRDAIQYFNSALQANPKYGPAMLNAAVLAYNSAATKPAALQRCRDYLAVHPKSQQSDAVKQLVRQLETELAPARPTFSNTVVAEASPPAKSNIITFVPRPSLQASTAPPRIAMQNTARPVATVAKTNAPVVMKTNQIAASATTATAVAEIPVTVVNVADAPIPKFAAAEPLVNTAAPALSPKVAPRPSPSQTSSPATDLATDESVPRRGFFTRLNPFRGKSKEPANESPRAVVPSPSSTPPAAEAVLPISAKPTFARYVYRSPRLPAPGNRAEAERVMQQALKAHQAANTNGALSLYQLAINADPSYFNAHYNSALLALQFGDLNRSLIGWEMALSIEPDSLNARYNFALALKQGGYAYDAANELERILEGKPTDSRAHLTLGNLYAQQLNDREKARMHYLKLLDLEPRNPQAPAIRFWLAANP